MDTSRFKNIRTFNDIKLEKARLRYDMLLAENSLQENLEGVQRLVTIGAFTSRITNGVHFVQDVYQRFSGIISWFRRKKTQQPE
ncbi:MAG: hypothetical protein K0B09_08245 [Bacteroidales bacterium]|nr:hypothetical protein [Bacteroidales bacterium]